MGLENILHDFKRNFKRKIFPIIISSMMACSGGTTNPNPNPPPPNPPNPPTQPQNHAPVMTEIPLQCTLVNENANYSCDAEAIDPDGDALTWTLTTKPSWLSINSQTGLMYGTAPEVPILTIFPIEVAVSDGKAPPVAQRYTLGVNNLFNTYLIDNNALEAASYSQGILVFSRPMNFALNDILGAGISDLLPNGFLGRVTTISPNKQIIYTTQASLEEIIKKANLSFSKTLFPSDAQSFSGLEGVSQNIQLAPYQPQPANFNFGISLNNVVLYDRDGNPNTKNDIVAANGNISFNTDFSFNIDIDDFTLQQIKFQNNISEKADITIGSNLIGIALKKEVKVAEYNFSPFIIGYLPTLIPIPLVVTPKISVNVGIDPTQVNPLSLRVMQDANLSTWLIYNGSWSPGSSFSNNFDFSIPSVTGDWNLKAYAGPKLEMLLYNITGPFAGINAILRLESQTGNCKLYGGLEAFLGVTMELFKKGIAAHAEKVFGNEKLLAQCTTTPPPPPPPTTSKILFARRIGNNTVDLYTMNPDGLSQTNLTNSSSLWNTEPSWSPDGTKIVYGSKIPFTSDDNDIYSILLNGSNKIQLTSAATDESNPVFSSDGTKIAYTASYTASDDQIYVMNSNGTSPVKITNSSGKYYWDLSWAPCPRIAAVSNKDNTNSEVYTLLPDGSDVRRLTTDSYVDRNPSWSPDCSKIAYVSTVSGSSDVYVMNADGTNKTNISNTTGVSEGSPSWSPDGTRIVYSFGTDNASEIWVMNSNGTGKTRLTNNSLLDGSPRWSPQ